MKTNIILTFCSFIKIHLEKCTNFFFTRLGRNGRGAQKLSYVCGGFNEKKIASSFACVYQPRSARRVFRPAHFFALWKKSASSPSAVNEFDKTYSTSPAPLLVRNWRYVCGAVAPNSRNISKTKLKKHRISYVNYQKVLVAPVPLTVDVLKSPRISWCA